MPDPQNEPELYTAVTANQIHTCNEKYKVIVSQSQIYENNKNPYYDDTIMKYMHRPLNPESENLTYPQYFEQYSITPFQPTTSYSIYCDQLQNYVIKHTKEIMVRYYYFKLKDGKLYFYQQLLLNYPTRSETVYKPTANQTYRAKFLSLFPDFLNNLQTQTATTHYSRLTYLNNQFSKILDRLLHSLNNQLPTNLHSIIIQSQLETLKILSHIFLLTATLELLANQYNAISIISMYIDFISNLFARLHNNAIAFGRINVIVVGDLFQFSSVSGQPVFKSATWSLFYPLFLRTSQCQNSDTQFFRLLEEVQTGRISTKC
ncbi:4545_t:CDS:2 [Gigaspora margarita]|uniref:4545_t:CDS:1 n=1 Tax=Gigaspora margarita TaxID=4874 RepID=A0ABN7V649_GIGMA|nr:4545_t:CDS:2 [Gigaspora margarita]